MLKIPGGCDWSRNLERCRSIAWRSSMPGLRRG